MLLRTVRSEREVRGMERRGSRREMRFSGIDRRGGGEEHFTGWLFVSAFLAHGARPLMVQFRAGACLLICLSVFLALEGVLGLHHPVGTSHATAWNASDPLPCRCKGQVILTTEDEDCDCDDILYGSPEITHGPCNPEPTCDPQEEAKCDIKQPINIEQNTGSCTVCLVKSGIALCDTYIRDGTFLVKGKPACDSSTTAEVRCDGVTGALVATVELKCNDCTSYVE